MTRRARHVYHRLSALALHASVGSASVPRDLSVTLTLPFPSCSFFICYFCFISEVVAAAALLSCSARLRTTFVGGPASGRLVSPAASGPRRASRSPLPRVERVYIRTGLDPGQGEELPCSFSWFLERFLERSKSYVWFCCLLLPGPASIRSRSSCLSECIHIYIYIYKQ